MTAEEFLEIMNRKETIISGSNNKEVLSIILQKMYWIGYNKLDSFFKVI